MGAALVAVTSGCPGDLSQPGADTGAASDGPITWQDSGPRPDGYTPGADSGGGGSDAMAKFTCNGDCHDYVMSRILIPTNSAQSKAYGLKKGGKSYNAFGDLLVLVGAQVSSLKLQEEVDLSVYKGSTLVLMRLKAASLTSTPAAKLQTWLGDSKTCCTNTSSLSACKSQAASGCFGGSASMSVASASPKDMIFSGAVSGGKLKAGPSKMILPLDNKGGNYTISLVAVTLTATTSANGLTSGVLSGAIPKSEMDNKLLPMLAAMVDTQYKSPSVDQKTKDLLKSLLDVNKDGSITAAELKSNPLLSNLLAGDVDADGDGSKDLSLGLGFTAAGCKIAGI